MRASVVWHRSVGFLLLACLLAIGINAYSGGWFNSGNYANPIVILTGFLAVAWFSALKLPEGARIVRFCTFAAPSVIAIYMLHPGMTHSSMIPWPRYLMQWFHPVFAFSVCAIVLFLFCLGLDVLRRRFLALVGKFPDATPSAPRLFGLLRRLGL